MPPLVPAARKVTDPTDWSGLELLAATVYLEAEGEPDEGKVAVAWVIRNRMDRNQKGVRETILAPYQFSCWNADYAGQRKARLTAPDPVVWERCWRAAAGAFWRLLPDPTDGARHYYNPALASPEWSEMAAARIRIGRHVFLKGVA
jgi:spore germination cell wall hydrolase CwlJ-like protein